MSHYLSNFKTDLPARRRRRGEGLGRSDLEGKEKSPKIGSDGREIEPDRGNFYFDNAMENSKEYVATGLTKFDSNEIRPLHRLFFHRVSGHS